MTSLQEKPIILETHVTHYLIWEKTRHPRVKPMKFYTPGTTWKIGSDIKRQQVSERASKQVDRRDTCILSGRARHAADGGISTAHVAELEGKLYIPS